MSKFLGPAPGREPLPQHCPTCGSSLDENGKCPNCARFAPAEDFSTYPRINNCPKCHEILDSAGFCDRCAKNRQVLVALALLFGMPVLGWGSCFLVGIYGPLSVVPLFLCIGGPALGVAYCIYLAFSWVAKRAKRQ